MSNFEIIQTVSEDALNSGFGDLHLKDPDNRIIGQMRFNNDELAVVIGSTQEVVNYFLELFRKSTK